MDELIDFKKRFLKNGELVSIPKKESYKRIMLLWAVSFFELNTSYTELQVNRVLSQLYPDYAVLRRYLVDYGFLLRDERGLKYEVNRDVHVLRASRPVRVLYIARGISEIGNWCANIALPMLIYEVTHDVSATALMVCCRFAPLCFQLRSRSCLRRWVSGHCRP